VNSVQVMKRSTSILNELKEISPLVAGISGKTFEIPEGYFEGLSNEILSRLEAEKYNPTILKDLPKTNPFQVPEKYFDEFAGNVLRRIKAGLVNSVEEELQILSPLLSKADKKNPFTIPVGYFDELTENVVTGTKAIEFVNVELENLSPVMTSLKFTNPFSVPERYFESLPAIVLNNVKRQQTSRIISLGTRRRFMRYAAAAILTGLVILASFLFFDRSGTKNNDADPLAGIEKVSDEAILNYLETSNVPFSDVTNTASVDIDAEDIKEMIADLPDEELQKYLAEHSTGRYPLTN